MTLLSSVNQNVPVLFFLQEHFHCLFFFFENGSNLASVATPLAIPLAIPLVTP